METPSLVRFKKQRNSDDVLVGNDVANLGRQSLLATVLGRDSLLCFVLFCLVFFLSFGRVGKRHIVESTTGSRHDRRNWK